MNKNNQRLSKKERISKKRYIDPSQNKIKKKYLHHKKGKSGIGINKKIRDVKRLMAHAEKSGATELYEAQKLKLQSLNKMKKNKRAAKYIDKKYKNIKFYGKKIFLKKKILTFF